MILKIIGIFILIMIAIGIILFMHSIAVAPEIDDL